ncbi:bifunctional tRNA (5-methylaminomethyl-2-thiouridine)(34)-methyltransferase MnmD/FAD-dependent 5-carboxymethylaminomethyl-2-thiouridine(34) oxidoreductase MnmC [Azonexus sp.]|uniref:bifunctional tRNA (5-methylaminomethyl-2-thiouridine)(34)-methyltransferase MnmD/FAD-dependent 5-carboxymethylaminomethyl-2-thiouridine(34) oxidoreductase MnmC n=1 Tax=Azonexus sp. TaxID=1872668 RepID=UPI0039E72905
MDALTPACLAFNADGTPVSAAYGDVYHSAHGGPAQARHVFLGGNDLPRRWQGKERFVILETGFGLGLNFLATWQAWRDDPQRSRRLHFVSYEKHPFTAADLAIAQQAWPEFADLAAELRAQWPLLTPGVHRLFFARRQVVLTLFFGDAGTLLRATNASVDAFYLDGFSPAKNPELWTPNVCKALSRLAAPGATLATWSVAAALRKALAEAEFNLEKRPGFAGKRDMLCGQLRSRRPDRHPPPAERRAAIIGAGIAGCTAAHALAAAGWQVDVFEQASGPASGASCNLAGMLRPLPSADDNYLSRLTRAGFLATRALLHTLPQARWSPCGVLHLAREPQHEATQQRVVHSLRQPSELLQFLDREQASALLGWPADIGGWWFPDGGWVNPASVCQAALTAFPERIRPHYGCPIAHFEHDAAGWRLFDATGAVVAQAPILIIAGGVGAQQFAQLAWLPQKTARGQVSHLPAGPSLPFVVNRYAYAMPQIDGQRLIGATLQYDDPDSSVRPADHAENLARLRLGLPAYTSAIASTLDPSTLTGRVGWRPMSPDRLPIVGSVPDPAARRGSPRLPALPRHPGLWCLQGFGTRGIVWSALMADLLLSRLEGEPLPLETDLVEAIDPGRFLLKQRHC